MHTGQTHPACTLQKRSALKKPSDRDLPIRNCILIRQHHVTMFFAPRACACLPAVFVLTFAPCRLHLDDDVIAFRSRRLGHVRSTPPVHKPAGDTPAMTSSEVRSAAKSESSRLLHRRGHGWGCFPSPPFCPSKAGRGGAGRSSPPVSSSSRFFDRKAAHPPLFPPTPFPSPPLPRQGGACATPPRALDCWYTLPASFKLTCARQYERH